MGFTKQLLEQKFPGLKNKLLTAKIDEKPEEFLKKKLLGSFYLSAGMAVLTFFLVDKLELSFFLIPLSFVVWFLIIFFTLVKSADSAISKRRKEIDRDVLFAGRFLLVKLNSGNSLIKSIEEASKSFGVANSYFKDIMKDIDMGTPLEEALENATNHCPSERLKKVLFQITNALEIGIDVSKIVESVLDDIAHQQLLEIEAYGKKLSSVALFYMLFAVVMPSLGMALLIVVASLVSLNVDSSTFLVFAFFLVMVEVFFITIFKSIRPDINI